MTATDAPARRNRGRPPLTAADVDKARAHLLVAIRAVFARVGYHGLSVELVIAEAGVSRPTFYKYFPSLDEAVERLVVQVNADLLGRMGKALASADVPSAKVEAAIEAWRQWGEDLGDFLRPFYTEFNDPGSPVGRHRQVTISLLATQITEAVALLGRAPPGPLRVATFIQGIEYLGYHYHLTTPGDAAAWAETRATMFRLALGLLGDAGDWDNATALARDFHVDLGRG